MSKEVKAHLALLAVAIIYGLNYTVAKGVMPVYLGPSGFILVRALGATVGFWLLWMGRKEVEIPRKELPRLALAALLGVALNQLMFFNGLSLTTPIHASILMTSSPMLVLLMGVLMGTEVFKPIRLVGILVGVAGAVHLITKGTWQFSGGDTALGDLMILVNAASYSAYLVVVKPLMAKYNAVQVIKWVFTLGLLMVLPFGWGQLIAADWINLPLEIWLGIAFVVLFTTFVAYLFNIFALRTVSSTTVAAYIYLQPVVATVVALAAGKDQFTWDQFFAGLLVFAGVYAVSLYKPKS